MENQNKGDIVIYQTKDGLTKIDVRFEDETVWLTQAQLVECNRQLTLSGLICVRRFHF